ncbi:hypothetical protein [Dactylosporangium sp. NPDC051541]|uniref:hypothetical protein n=1 Tax=Dactylosporangium sp. NPDC051541 TaxID=3363977 RepID=UPI0037BC8D21
MTLDPLAPLGRVPLDSQQREVHRLLELMGGAPADQYADAIRMLAAEPALKTRSHLVGHMARELDSMLRELLGALIPADRRSYLNSLPKGEGQRDPDRRSVVDEICSALGVADDDEVRELWKTASWHDVAHRAGLIAPRPVDDMFRQKWGRFQTVLLVVGRRFEASYTLALPLIDQLAAQTEVTTDDVKQLRNGVPNSTVALARFFDRASAGWFPKLRKANYFDSPPRLQPTEDGFFAYQPWPAGRYLVRMAADPNLAPAVVAVASHLDTDNPEAAESVADIALAVSPTLAAALCPTIARMLDGPGQWALPSKARDVVLALVSAGHRDAAVLVFEQLLPQPAARSSTGHLPASFTAQAFPAFDVVGVKAVAERLSRAPGKVGDHLAGSTRWWPGLESDTIRSGRDRLVVLLRDAAAAVATAGRLREVLQVLDEHEAGIFRRLTLWLLTRIPDKAFITRYLTDPVWFADNECFQEYGALLRASYEQLDANDRDKILSYVDDITVDGAAAERRLWARLGRFGDVLPDGRKAELEKLVATWGAPAVAYDVIKFESSDDGRSVDEPAFANLNELTNDAIVEYLASWEPTGAWRDPGISDLRQVLEAAVLSQPQRFSALASRFTTLDPAYGRGLLSALRRSLRGEDGAPAAPLPSLDWDCLLDFGFTVTAMPRLLPVRPGGGDSGWKPCRREVANLLIAGLQTKQLPDSLLDRALSLITALLNDPDPGTPDDPEPDPASLWMTAEGTVRGDALRALLEYARRRHDPQTPAFEPTVRDLLERHLDPTVDPSPSMRALYGQHINLLVSLDPTWTRTQVERIFPHTTEPGIRSAAWTAYLRFSSLAEPTIELLTPLYLQHATALDALEQPEVTDERAREDQPEDRLAQHLAVLYRHGAIALSGEIMTAFFAHASLRLRSRLIECTGLQMHNDDPLSQEETNRLQQLWTARLASAMDRPGELDELSGFGWWFTSGQFPAGWALEQLQVLLRSGGAVTNTGSEVAERLASLCSENLAEVVAATALLIDAPNELWFITGSRQELTDVLSAGVASADVNTKRLAADTVNRLVARGFTTFENLLKPSLRAIVASDDDGQRP